ncbi:carbohydrate ABC transporter permease [Truepera radiovictrix]|uniref:sn-glycerol-3-phosphate transport system permease protein UgpA n=1 Tax=Truepera radiovictrix (strain DSM 17093 / CIP 108686 / LMG 22925 / RQ-24) TaxID=649638 RepID=D7CSV6_TRURR|nr:sugar ABC transporter permease [Truepera radiovictrix]ADI13723.1 binding-protein-dependent transport systems inner membrane component [Truepera radiovictrix DSM 17093]WMT57712.1 sugar ABC transporter permease [Truepera radiovictrix]
MTQPVFKSRWLALLLLLPTLLILLVFIYYPLLQSFVLSTTRSNLFLGTRQFVGLDNFRALFAGPLAPAYYQAMGQTLVFSVLVVVIGLAVGLAMASLANQNVRGARVYRLLLIWPFALSPAVAGTIFLFLFNPQVGVVNDILGSLFGIRPRWIDTPSLTFPLVTAAAIWKNLGYNIVFYLAALRNIPAELGEAAQLDGASAWGRFWRVTFPMLGPMTFFLVFTNLTFAFFDSFGLIDIMTRGGPIGRPPFDETGVTTTLMYKIFQDGFSGTGNLGAAAAQSIILLFIVATLALLQFRFGNRRVYYGGEGA